MSASQHQETILITALLKSRAYNHPTGEIKLIETHISWVILTGTYAYKIKKPLNLGFLDFSSLSKRKQCCEEELRLNSRTATGIYLEVVSINGTAESPGLAGDGDIIEYAVKMKQFPQQCQLDHLLLSNKLTTSELKEFANMVANFHQSTSVAETNTKYGGPNQVLEPVNENIFQIRNRVKDIDCNKALNKLEQWIKQQEKELFPLFNLRKSSGFIRECHGDLHLRNLAWIDNKPVAFDCIEFNPYLRWIDVISDIAFLIMDLHSRNQFELSQCFLNSYLEITGDYEGIKLLPFYSIYRALVRAKVDAINMTESHVSNIDLNHEKKELFSYIKLAKSYTEQQPVKLIITHGVSGSGKTTFTQSLLQAIPAIRIRSDIERKRLAGQKKVNKVRIDQKKNIYTKEFTDFTYKKLEALAETIINSGFSVIVDATFLDKSKRDQFRNLANLKQVEFMILSFTAPEPILKKRISDRDNDESDADLNVLKSQLSIFKDLDSHELSYSHIINTEKDDLSNSLSYILKN